MSQQTRNRYHSIPLRSTREATTTAPQTFVSSRALPALPDEESMHGPARFHNSTRRYPTTGEQVIQQGNRRMVIRHIRPRKQQRVHWLVPAGLGMIVALALVVGCVSIGSAWNANQINSQFGMPRTWQTDAVLGLDHDSAQHPTHIQCENLRGQVLLLVIPAGDAKDARLYHVTTLYGPNADQTPITATFANVNHDGRPDLIIHLGAAGDIALINTGTGFAPV